MQIQNNKNWLLRALPHPVWIPKQWETVQFKEGKKLRPALVLTQPIEPQAPADISALTQRPFICDLLVGEVTLKDIDISVMKPLK